MRIYKRSSALLHARTWARIRAGLARKAFNALHLDHAWSACTCCDLAIKDTCTSTHFGLARNLLDLLDTDMCLASGCYSTVLAPFGL
mmetsp:Transcript_46454/g.143917  ORF Transcript_46454/g.143917 Transcript_46454/m.143917 type:complete len:87 (+) Transcript_46454:357-617(+)